MKNYTGIRVFKIKSLLRDLILGRKYYYTQCFDFPQQCKKVWHIVECIDRLLYLNLVQAMIQLAWNPDVKEMQTRQWLMQPMIYWHSKLWYFEIEILQSHGDETRIKTVLALILESDLWMYFPLEIFWLVCGW